MNNILSLTIMFSWTDQKYLVGLIKNSVGLIINIATTLLLVYCCPTATERSSFYLIFVVLLRTTIWKRTHHHLYKFIKFT